MVSTLDAQANCRAKNQLYARINHICFLVILVEYAKHWEGM